MAGPSLGTIVTAIRAAQAQAIKALREQAAAAPTAQLAASLTKMANDIQEAMDSESSAHVLTVVFEELKAGKSVITHRPDDLF